MKKLEQLYQHISPKVYAFFYVKTSDRNIAEDLTQDTFYEAVKGYRSFLGKSSIQTWVFAIAKNMLKKYYRSNTYKENLKKCLSLENEPPPLIEEEFLLREDHIRLVERIEKLDSLKREIVILRVYGELSFKEIGDLVGKSENYARVHFHRTKLMLQKEMGGLNEEGMFYR